MTSPLTTSITTVRMTYVWHTFYIHHHIRASPHMTSPLFSLLAPIRTDDIIWGDIPLSNGTHSISIHLRVLFCPSPRWLSHPSYSLMPPQMAMLISVLPPVGVFVNYLYVLKWHQHSRPRITDSNIQNSQTFLTITLDPTTQNPTSKH